jgi:hypothetical protein
MSDAIKIPYVGYGDKGYITQDVAEQQVKTAEYWYKKYCDLKDFSDDTISLYKNAFKINNRIIMLLSVVCIIETLFLLGGL